jgi:hypothetical protein
MVSRFEIGTMDVVVDSIEFLVTGADPHRTRPNGTLFFWLPKS